jgi:hypothetical protein
MTTLPIFLILSPSFDNKIITHLSRSTQLSRDSLANISTHNKKCPPTLSTNSEVDPRRRAIGPWPTYPVTIFSPNRKHQTRATHLMSLQTMQITDIDKKPRLISPKHRIVLTFLNSEAHFRIAVDIGGGSVAWVDKTGKTRRFNFCSDFKTKFASTHHQ